jgi:hypothetical protein
MKKENWNKKIIENEKLEYFFLISKLISVELFLASITLIELSLINIPDPPLCTGIHFQHHYGHMTQTPEQYYIHVQINNDVCSKGLRLDRLVRVGYDYRY